MTGLWLRGLLARRAGRLAAAAAGVAVAVALLASLGVFLAASKATMTKRATASVAVDWQVELAPGTSVPAATATVRSAPGVTEALPVGFAKTAGFESHAGRTVQTTGPGVAVGLPPGYADAFPGELRRLTGTDGVLLAQQTASNLHAGAGDTISIKRSGLSPVAVKVAGVVDLPLADSLFQKVGAAPQSQPVAPPDNVILLPARLFSSAFAPLAVSRPDLVTTQIHVGRSAALPADPAAAFTRVTSAAHNLEAALSGQGVVGDNLAASLDGARKDALYAQVLFLFLGLPGAILAGLLTAAIAAAGATARRRQQALLRIRGATLRQVGALAGAEAAIVGLTGGVVGLAASLLVGRLAFGSNSFGATGSATLAWTSVAFLVGLTIAAATMLVPALTDFRRTSVMDSRAVVGRSGSPRWMRFGLDIVLLVCSALVFWVTSRNGYTLVLAPEGVASISVNYWSLLGPALLWLGGGLLAWRVAFLVLGRGRRAISAMVRPASGALAPTAAASMSRQRHALATSIVLLGLAVSFAASTAVFNATYRQQAEVDARLTNGADVTVTRSPGAGADPSLPQKLGAVRGVRSVEPLQHRFAYVGADLQDLYGVRPSTIASATSLQDAYFQGGTAGQLIGRLAAQPNSVLVSSETVKDFQLRAGDTLNLRLQNSRTGALVTVPFRYAGIANEFPTAPKDSFFVANADYVARVTGDASVGAYLIDTGGRSTASVAARIRADLGPSATITDISSTRTVVGSSLTSVDLAGLTRVELAFALVLAAAAGGLVLALGLAERRRTFALASVLGASRRQVRGLVFSEAMVVAAGGVVAGAAISWVLARMLVKVLTGVFDPPPAVLSVPWGYLTATLAISLAAIVIAAVVSARASRRPAVEEIREL